MNAITPETTRMLISSDYESDNTLTLNLSAQILELGCRRQRPREITTLRR